jgi:hypothetical protein
MKVLDRLRGRVGETNLVSEYGLYNLVLGSRKKEAKNGHEKIMKAFKNNKVEIYKHEDIDYTEIKIIN